MSSEVVELEIVADASQARREVEELQRQARESIDVAIGKGATRSEIGGAILSNSDPRGVTPAASGASGATQLAAAEREALLEAEALRRTVNASRLARQRAESDRLAGTSQATFSRANVERQLLSAYGDAHGSSAYDIDRERLLEPYGGSQNAFTFRDRLPGEVRSFLEGRPHLRRLFRTTVKSVGASGPDAMSELGDRYFRLAEEVGSSDHGQKAVQEAIRFAAQSRDPHLEFLADIHPNLIGGGKTLDREATKAKRRETGDRRARVMTGDAQLPYDVIDPAKLKFDDEFSFRSESYRVLADDQGNRLLLSGSGREFYVDGIEGVPVERGTLRNPNPLYNSGLPDSTISSQVREKYSKASQSAPTLASQSAPTLKTEVALPPPPPPGSGGTVAAPAPDDDPVARGSAVGRDLFGRPVYLNQGNEQRPMFLEPQQHAVPGASQTEADRRIAKQYDPRATAEMFPPADVPARQDQDREGDAPKRRRPASWVVRDKVTKDPIFETFNESKLDKINRDKYEAVPVGRHLADLNRREGRISRGLDPLPPLTDEEYDKSNTSRAAGKDTDVKPHIDPQTATRSDKALLPGFDAAPFPAAHPRPKGGYDTPLQPVTLASAGGARPPGQPPVSSAAPASPAPDDPSPVEPAGGGQADGKPKVPPKAALEMVLGDDAAPGRTEDRQPVRLPVLTAAEAAVNQGADRPTPALAPPAPPTPPVRPPSPPASPPPPPPPENPDDGLGQNVDVLERQKAQMRDDLRHVREGLQAANASGDRKRAAQYQQVFTMLRGSPVAKMLDPDDEVLRPVKSLEETRAERLAEAERVRQAARERMERAAAGRDERMRDRFETRLENRLSRDETTGSRQDLLEDRALRRLGSDEARARVASAVEAYQLRGETRPVAFRQAFSDEGLRQRVERQIERVPEPMRPTVRGEVAARQDRTGETVEQAAREVVREYQQTARAAERARRAMEQETRARERAARGLEAGQTREQSQDRQVQQKAERAAVQERQKGQQEERRIFDSSLAAMSGPARDRALLQRRQELMSRGLTRKEAGVVLPVDPLDAREVTSIDQRRGTLRQNYRGNTIGGQLNRSVLPVGGFGLFFNVAFGAMEAVPAVQANAARMRSISRGDNPMAQYEANMAAVNASSGGMFGVLASLVVDPTGRKREEAERTLRSAERQDLRTERRANDAKIAREYASAAEIASLSGLARRRKEIENSRDEATTNEREAANLRLRSKAEDGSAELDDIAARVKVVQNDMTVARDRFERQIKDAARGDGKGNRSSPEALEKMRLEYEQEYANTFGPRLRSLDEERDRAVEKNARERDANLANIDAASQAQLNELDKEESRARRSMQSERQALDAEASGDLYSARDIRRRERDEALRDATDAVLGKDVGELLEAQDRSGRAEDNRVFENASRSSRQFRGQTEAVLRGDSEGAARIASDAARQGALEGVRQRFGDTDNARNLSQDINAQFDADDDLSRREFSANRAALLGDTYREIMETAGHGYEGRRFAIAAQRDRLAARFGDAQPAQRIAAEISLGRSELANTQLEVRRRQGLTLEKEVLDLRAGGKFAEAQAATVRGQYVSRMATAQSDEERRLIGELGVQQLTQMADEQGRTDRLVAIDPLRLADSASTAAAGQRRGGFATDRAEGFRAQAARLQVEAFAERAGSFLTGAVGRGAFAVLGEAVRREDAAGGGKGDDGKVSDTTTHRLLGHGKSLLERIATAAENGVSWGR